MIERTRIAHLEALLGTHGIRFPLDDGTYTCVGTPEAAVVESGKDADVERIQRVLDSVR